MLRILQKSFSNALLIDQISEIRTFSLKTAINEASKDGSYLDLVFMMESHLIYFQNY